MPCAQRCEIGRKTSPPSVFHTGSVNESVIQSAGETDPVPSATDPIQSEPETADNGIIFFRGVLYAASIGSMLWLLIGIIFAGVIET